MLLGELWKVSTKHTFADIVPVWYRNESNLIEHLGDLGDNDLVILLGKSWDYTGSRFHAWYVMTCYGPGWIDERYLLGPMR